MWEGAVSRGTAGTLAQACCEGLGPGAQERDPHPGPRSRPSSAPPALDAGLPNSSLFSSSQINAPSVWLLC